MPKRSRNIKQSDLKGNKPWLKRGSTSKQKIQRKARKTYLIVCEGQTEEYYFRSFHSVAITIKAVNLGRSQGALVNCAMLLAEDETYDEAWVVFDYDFERSAGQGQYAVYNEAITAARKGGLKVAYSNDAFELWLYLHYAFLDRQESREFYYQFLSKQLDVNYVREGKSLAFARKLRQCLEEDSQADYQRAIRHAKKLHEAHQHLPFHEQNPVTTVYKLVESILEEEG